MEHQTDNKDPRFAGASSAADRVAQDASDLGDKAKSNIAKAAESARTEARRFAHQRKDVGAEKLGGVADAVHGAARSLEAEMPQTASYIHEAAVRIEDAARAMRHRSVDELMSGISSFARTQPAVFFGGAMLAGFALTRFLKSSQQQDSGWRLGDTRSE